MKQAMVKQMINNFAIKHLKCIGPPMVNLSSSLQTNIFIYWYLFNWNQFWYELQGKSFAKLLELKKGISFVWQFGKAGCKSLII